MTMTVQCTMRLSIVPQVRVVILALIVAVAVPAYVAAQHTTPYANGIRMFRAERWAEAVALFEQARAAKREETGRVQVSGNNTEAYRPSYFIGEALFRMGNCPAALQAWAQAEQWVQGDRSYLTRISEGRQKCPPAPVAPDAALLRALNEAESVQKEAATARQVAMAGSTDPAVAEAIKSQAALQDTAQRTLVAAEARLAEARQGRSAAAAADAVRQFRAATAQFNDLSQRIKTALGARADANNRFDTLRATAQQSLDQAAAALASASAAGASGAPLQTPQAQLANARAAFEQAVRTRALDDLQGVVATANTSRDAFQAAEAAARRQLQAGTAGARAAVADADALQRRLGELLRGGAPSAEAADATARLRRAADQIAAAAPSAADVEAANIAATSARQIFQREIDALVAGQFNTAVADAQVRLDAAGREFGRLQAMLRSDGVTAAPEETRSAAAISRRLAGAQDVFERGRRDRSVPDLVEAQQAADSITGDIAKLLLPLQARLAEASGIPSELNLAAREFFAGRYDVARDALTRVQMAQLTAPVRLQASLFRAASLFGLYVRSGERDSSLREAAAAAVNECRKLMPAYTPDGNAFSPRFIKFYQSPW